MSNNRAVVLFGQGQPEDLFSRPSPSCAELAKKFYASDLQLDQFVSNAYQYFASQRAEKLFRALHHGIAVLSMQGQVTSAERISAISPHTVDPYERFLWVPVHVRRDYQLKDGSSYEGPLFKAPLSEIEYEPASFQLPFRQEETRNCPTSGRPLKESRVKDIPCIKRTISESEDFLERRTYAEDGSVDSEGEYHYDPVSGTIYFSDDYSGTETIKAGYQTVQKTDENGEVVYEQVPTYEEVPDRTREGYWRRGPNGDRIYRRGSVNEWTDGDVVTVTDESSPVEVERPLFDVPAGTYWIPRIKVESDYLWDVTAKGVGFEEEMTPSKYTPEHWPYLLQLFEFGLQRGAEQFALRSALSGLAGNPFSYADGRIIGKETGTDRDYIVIDPDDPEDAPDGQDVIYCEAPRGKGTFYKSNGTHVSKFETLLREDPVEITYNYENTDITWSDPLETSRVDEKTLQIDSKGRGEGFRFFLDQALQYTSPNLSTWGGVRRGYFDVEVVDQTNEWGVRLSAEDQNESGEFHIGEELRLEVGQEDKEEAQIVTVQSVSFDGTNTILSVEENLSSVDPDEAKRLHRSKRETDVWGEEAEWNQASWFWLNINQIVTNLAGRQVRIRNLTQSTTQYATIRRVRPVDEPGSNYGIVIDKHIPQSTDKDDVVIQVVTDPPEDPTDITIDVENIPYNGVEKSIETFAREALPRGVRFRLNLVQQWWTAMPYNWGTYESTWDGQDCPENVLLWDGPYDSDQKDAWGWAENNNEEADDEIWGISKMDWG